MILNMADASPVAIVTGSSSGIGKTIAIRLACEGYHVVLNYSSNALRAEQALAECLEIDPDSMMVKADLGNAHEAASLAAKAVRAFGRIDVLVNNAARVIDRPALDITEHDWDSVVDVNLKGAFFAAQHAARQMLTQEDGGTILNIGSSTGIRARRNGVNTCASKAGLMIITQCLALELGPKIRVNTIIPGLVVTDETEQRFKLNDPAVRHAREDAIPLQRLGQPEDVANAVMMMLGNDARFITGQRLVVDGGQNMW
jgi:3-oxoacyl-[acyl-carrier protein] reductase